MLFLFLKCDLSPNSKGFFLYHRELIGVHPKEECGMMQQMGLEEFLNDPEKVIREAAANGKFTAVKVDRCKAVIISEEEWKIMCEGLQLLINGKIK